MTQVSLPNDAFLRKEFVVPRIFQIMEPYLAFLNILPKVKSDSRAIRYKQEAYSSSTDPKKKTPRRISPRSQWTYLDITQMEIKSAILNKEGFAIRIDEDAIQFTEGVDEINRAYNKVAYWLAQHLNTLTATALTDGATDLSTDWTPTAVWSDAGATPVDDLIRLEAQMEREGYPYVMTDIFIHKTNFYEMKAYLTSMDISDRKQKEIYGMPAISRHAITIPVVGSTIHKLLSGGIDEGYILALDAKNPAGTIYYNNNPKYSTEKIAYKTSEGMKTVQNIGFNFNRYVDDETHDTVMQFWIDQVCVVKEAYAALYDSGI